MTASGSAFANLEIAGNDRDGLEHGNGIWTIGPDRQTDIGSTAQAKKPRLFRLPLSAFNNGSEIAKELYATSYLAARGHHAGPLRLVRRSGPWALRPE
jgi:hypothetical protein